MMIEPEEVPEPMETTFSSDQTADGEFLSLDELGKVLRQLALQGVIQHSPLENVHQGCALREIEGSPVL